MFLHVIFERLEITGRKKGMTGEEKMYPQESPRNPPGKEWRPAGSRSDLGGKVEPSVTKVGFLGRACKLTPREPLSVPYRPFQLGAARVPPKRLKQLRGCGYRWEFAGVTRATRTPQVSCVSLELAGSWWPEDRGR
ncbi:hypothetical protein mRhiFer1_008689 [Rhinolophus ferrumequinum]|uniref:Uncharacterized protein n=1 Tax=Rhinolophus ferrumequinum TaxID=59479 RepID=A0A7J7TRC6_RHIFE|nr:hypothetical protein mRhiFer1_008689 [Rhinolophus ferrumequinum]